MAKRIILAVSWAASHYLFGAPFLTWFSSSATLGFSRCRQRRRRSRAARRGQRAGPVFFPGYDMKAMRALPKEQAEAANKAWTEKWKAGPRGLLIIHPETTSAGPWAGQRWAPIRHRCLRLLAGGVS